MTLHITKRKAVFIRNFEFPDWAERGKLVTYAKKGESVEVELWKMAGKSRVSYYFNLPTSPYRQLINDFEIFEKYFKLK